MKRSTNFALVIAVGLAAMIGVAFAAIPDSETGVISGCIGKSGILRVIDSQAGAACTPSETPLNWNATGPRGPSDLWPGNFIFSAEPVQTISGDLTWEVYETYTPLSSVALPAGAFSVSAKTSLVEQSDSAANFNCILTRTGLDQLLDDSWEGATTGNPANLALQATLTLSEPDVVSLRCASTGPATFPSGQKLSAIQVDVAHQPPPVA